MIRVFRVVKPVLLTVVMMCVFGCESKNHDCVDMGLPSGILWATCNLGADNPEDFGDYFAWGEVKPKTVYNWDTYKYCNGDYDQLTKYCNKSNCGYNGFVDDLVVLQPSDDAATVKWGKEWHTPTKEQWLELINNTTSVDTIQNGVNGFLFTASNGNRLFMPFAGNRVEDITTYADGGDCGTFWFCHGYYMSGSLDVSDPNNNWHYSGDISSGGRAFGIPVRAVSYSKDDNTIK